MGRAILPAGQLSSWSSRLKGGCGHDWPPHEEKYVVLGETACPTREEAELIRSTVRQMTPELTGSGSYRLGMRSTELNRFLPNVARNDAGQGRAMIINCFQTSG